MLLEKKRLLYTRQTVHETFYREVGLDDSALRVYPTGLDPVANLLNFHHALSQLAPRHIDGKLLPWTTPISNNLGKRFPELVTGAEAVELAATMASHVELAAREVLNAHTMV